MCAMAAAPREMARDAGPAPMAGPAPIYVVCSPSRRVGKTLVARCLTEYHVADGRAVAAYDLSDESPQLTDYLPRHAASADIADIRGQMAPMAMAAAAAVVAWPDGMLAYSGRQMNG